MTLTFTVSNGETHDVTTPNLRGPTGAPPMILFNIDAYGNLIFELEWADSDTEVTAEINDDGELIVTSGVD